MNKYVAATGIGFIAAGIVILAWFTAPPLHPNNCTPRLIQKYTMDIISHKDCEAMPRCIIEPKDIRYFHTAQLNFNQCVLQVLEESKKEKEAEE